MSFSRLIRTIINSAYPAIALQSSETGSAEREIHHHANLSALRRYTGYRMEKESVFQYLRYLKHPCDGETVTCVSIAIKNVPDGA